MIAGTALGGLSQYRQGQAAAAQAKGQAQISNYNAQVADANAEAIKQKSTFDQVRALKTGRRIMGKVRGRLGAAGAVLSEGAPADVVAEQGFENALDVALIGHEGLVGAKRQRSAAALSRFEAANFLQSARNAQVAAGFNVASTLLTGFGGMASMGMFSSGSNPSSTFQTGGDSSTADISGSSFTNPQAVFGAPSKTKR
jgi:hypothetical protein